MDLSAFTLDFDPATDISNGASKFTDVIKLLMQEVLKNPDSKKSEGEHLLNAALYKEFFAYAGTWALMEKTKAQKEEDHPEAGKFKQRASEAVSDLERNMIDYAHCYMRINRASGTVRKLLNAQEVEAKAGKKIKWTSETGIMLQRYRKEREMLKRSNERMAKGSEILAGQENSLEQLEADAPKIFGKQGEEYLRAFRSSLRTADFIKAQRSLSALVASKKKFALGGKGDDKSVQALESIGKKFMTTLEQNTDHLTSPDGRMFLKSGEVDVVIRAQEKEIEKKSEYINKYHLPYMENKLRALQHLKDKLLVVGSLDGLITLYIRLIRGMAQPISDMKGVREYEEEVIGHVIYLLGGQFQETVNIERWIVEEMQEFDNAMNEYQKWASA